MTRLFLRFVSEHTALYFTLCCGLGLLGRWYVCGRDIGRFLNPFAPLFG